MASPLFSVGGIFSGLDTNSIIEQLMEAERAPVTRMESKRALYQARVGAWSMVQTELSSVSSAADKLKTLAAFDKFSTVTSSSTAVGVSVSGTATPGSISFTVGQLATSHKLVSNNSFASATEAVGAGTFTITSGGTDHDFVTTASTTVTQLAQQINNAGIGIKASVVSPDGTTSKLLLTAQSGAGNQFTTAATQASLATFDLTETGVDASLTIGSGPGAITVTRSSNTITDLLTGVTITLKEETASAVTVDVARDVDGAVEAITGFIDEINGALTAINDLTKYNAETQVAGLLQGDAAAWGLSADLRKAVSDVVSQVSGTYTSASSVGITLKRDGTYEIDEAKLRGILTDDPDAISRLFARSGSAADSRMGYVFASDKTVAGSYAVQVTQAAEVARITSGAYVAPGADETFDIVSGSRTANVTIAAGSSLSQAIDAIQDALDAAGITTVKALDGGGTIQLEETRYGAANKFTVSGDDLFSMNGTFAGLDVAGTINGLAATGSGRLLRSTTGASEGLQVEVTATTADVTGAGGTLALGDLAYTNGISGRTMSMIGLATAAKGSLTIAGARWETQIQLINDQIEAFEARLISKEDQIRRQFTAMESALQKLSAQGDWLAAQVSQGGQQ
jgi:flagellar hook-associated protein 2